MPLDGNICVQVNSTAEFIPTAICLLKKYVTAKANIVNGINLTPDNSQQKAETEALISQFDLAIRRFESSLKPLDKKIDASIYSLSRQQKFVQGKNSPLPSPLINSRQCLTVASTSTDESNSSKTINRNNNPGKVVPGVIWPEDHCIPTTCPFCKRNCSTRSSLSEHINEKHPKQNEVYENISSLTPEFMLATEKTISGNRQCFYCTATFRSNAPLFRHIQEAHVAFFDIFVNISLVKGDTMQCLKSNNVNRVTPVSTLHPIQSCITRPAPTKPVNDRKYAVLTSSSGVPVVTIETSGPVTPTVTPASAMSTPQNARKSIRTSTITRLSPTVAISSSTQSADTSPSVQAATVKVASSTSPKGTEPIHSARKRRMVTCNMPAPASKKVAALAKASGSRIFSCSLCSKQFASATALSIHNSHYCSMRPAEVIEASKGSLPSLPNGSAVTQSRAISSTRESPNQDAACSDDESLTRCINEVPSDVKRKLIKTIRDGEVILNTIHQEDLVSCMHSINFRKLQNLELV